MLRLSDQIGCEGSLKPIERRGRFQLVPVALLTYSFGPGDFRTRYAVTTSLYRISYAFYDVPQNVILAFAAHTECGQLSALRLFGSSIANTLLSLLLYPSLPTGHHTFNTRSSAVSPWPWPSLELQRQPYWPLGCLSRRMVPVQTHRTSPHVTANDLVPRRVSD